MKKINLVEKINGFREKLGADLSSDEDLSIAIMHLISLEEHCFWSAEKTGNKKFYGIMQEIRDMRKNLLGKIVKNPEGEEWCISKHLLGGTMRLLEVGAKCHSAKKREEADSAFSKAYDLYCMFWAINMKLIGSGEAEEKISGFSKDAESKNGGSVISEKLRSAIKKLVDCCKEW